MEWNLDKERALCPQICEKICLKIALGEFKPDEKLFSVREAAVSAGVNPNTVQRSFGILEQQGIVYSVRGSGWYVASDTSMATQTLQNLIDEKTSAYFDAMSALGLTVEQTKKLIEEWKI